MRRSVILVLALVGGCADSTGLAGAVDAYESWDVHQFYGPLYYDDSLNYPPDLVDPDEPRNRGAKLNLWCDVAEFEPIMEAIGEAP